MKYNFDEIVNRKNTNSLKWNVTENELPMWVADMDFKTAPEITNAIIKIAEHGIFGYSVIPDEWYSSIIKWWKNRHNFVMQKEELIFCTGVVPAISSIVRKLTIPAENVLIMTPVYNIFFNSIINNGRNVLQCPLEYNGNEYHINFKKLERELSNQQTTMMILCNPHNPTGIVWNRETLKKIGDLCAENNVIVVSDEIHCDLTETDCNYIPFASVSENCRNNSITCIAPTKTFNIAGLQTSAVFVPNKFLYHRVWRGLNTDEVAEPNSFAVAASIAAFTYGEDWLDELREYISDNKNHVRSFVETKIPQLKVVPSRATYLLWIDCSNFLVNTNKFVEFLREKTGLYLSHGSQYGGNGDKFIRLNVACSRKTLDDGLNRLKNGVQMFEQLSDELCY